MDSSIRKMLWGAFAALTVLVILGLALTLTVLQIGRRQEYRIVHGSAPLIDAVNSMGLDITTMVSAARGYIAQQQSQFAQQYDDAVRDFAKSDKQATELTEEPRDLLVVGDLRRHYFEVRQLADKQFRLAHDGKIAEASDAMLELARVRRSAPDYVGILTENHRRSESEDLERLGMLRQELALLMIVISLVIVGIGGYAIAYVQRSLMQSIARQVKRTETMIAGMADGVMLVDKEGRTVFINPAGQKLLGRSDVGIPIFQHADIYSLRNEEGKPIDQREVPAAQALSTGRAINDVTMFIDRKDRGNQIAISMTATPLHDDGQISGVIVTFRDVTERRRLEEEMQLQAERAQILADAGAFFASNIDPVWVTQAIAERIAEVLGDWSAVILKSNDSSELRVAAIHHRDMTSLGLAWSYIYRQPLVVGEGIIGQVVSTGYPSLMSNVGSVTQSSHSDETSYHAPSMKLASLLILPLRTRREILGVLVIAANDPQRVMTDDKLPLAEVLAERAALAIENAKLYTEQVEARRKVEDLSRLKDEFLSIASHELRTPVTSIKGYTQLAKTLIRENDLTTSEEYLDIALDQIDRMSRLILELLDVSRIETGRLEIRREPIQWSTFVRDVVHRHHTAVSDRRFHLNVPDSDGKVVIGDRDRLEQVLGNLLENAVKYSPDGSEISVSVEERAESVVTSVCDRGIGIPTDELAQVFERFHRGRHVSSTNYGGLGLGLYITKQIVERHAGSIWVDSKEGSGTTFFFSLPVVPVPATAPATSAAS
ncbi:MAG: putative multi-sensor signal transduction histidine kinase [Acidobacteria bacterium]|nr:putative multi-sensor signal transduction histidine kinase [Acidobacteriota bacterium]